MNEQNKKDAEYLREFIKSVHENNKNMLIPACDLLEEIAARLDPEPERPSDGEIVEVESLISKMRYVGYARERYIYSVSDENNIPVIEWDECKLIRILPDPDKCIVIEKPSIWPAKATGLRMQLDFICAEHEWVGLIPTKIFTRKELEAK